MQASFSSCKQSFCLGRNTFVFLGLVGHERELLIMWKSWGWLAGNVRVKALCLPFTVREISGHRIAPPIPPLQFLILYILHPARHLPTTSQHRRRPPVPMVFHFHSVPPHIVMHILAHNMSSSPLPAFSRTLHC